MDDIGDIAYFYDADPDAEEERLARHQLEFDLTWRLIEKFVPERVTVLEIGCAAGAYTVPLARRGHPVVAVDLSTQLLARCRDRLAGARLAHQARFVRADARDLNGLGETLYDAVLLMGPLYHLVIQSDRALALAEAIKHLRPGGILISAHISRFGIMGDLMKNVPGWIEDCDEVRTIIEQGRDPDHCRAGGFRGYFATAEEIAPLHENAGLETLLLAGVEPAISADDESYNSLVGERRRLWLDLLEEICDQPSIVGASRHLLYAGRLGV